MNLLHVFRYQVPVFVWMLAIFTLSSIPTIPTFKFPISPDKLGHAGIYFVLCMLWERALFHQDKVQFLRRHALLVSFCLTAAHGIFDEVYQMSVPGRSADVYDTMADTAGAGLFLLWRQWKTRGEERKNLT
ncbi:MAG: VanZ family protein [Bacteroidota bacterium]